MSDLTATAFAGTRHLHLWRRYCDLLFEGHSVRACARRLGIDKDTAWRWRHRVLAALAARELPALRGIVEAHETNFAFSQKGSRRLRDAAGFPRPARRRGDRRWSGSRHRVWVVMARDRTGRSRAVVVGERRPGSRALERVLTPRDTAAVTALLSVTGSLGPFGTLCRRRGVHFVRVHRSGRGEARPGWFATERPRRAGRHVSAEGGQPGESPGIGSPVPGREAAAPLSDTLVHLRSVREQETRLRKWMLRFRGVASRYLQHYLVWHGIVDVLGRPGDVVLLRSVDAVVGPPEVASGSMAAASTAGTGPGGRDPA